MSVVRNTTNAFSGQAPELGFTGALKMSVTSCHFGARLASVSKWTPAFHKMASQAIM